jgi:hypothetical protein
MKGLLLAWRSYGPGRPEAADCCVLLTAQEHAGIVTSFDSDLLAGLTS